MKFMRPNFESKITRHIGIFAETFWILIPFMLSQINAFSFSQSSKVEGKRKCIPCVALVQKADADAIACASSEKLFAAQARLKKAENGIDVIEKLMAATHLAALEVRFYLRCLYTCLCMQHSF